MLTQREREIAMLVVEGMTNKEIARRLDVSHRTVEAHRSRMMEKLGARNTAELISSLVGLPADGKT
ncbi:Tetrathionate response regulatory protein TtrR [compost metagenome]